MPFCDIDKDVSLHYTTNTPKGDASDLDRNKPTIIFLPPIFGAVTMWLREQLQDPRLYERYNLIAFDQRNMGKTIAPSCPERDTWVDAADVAIAHEVLQLPPCHVFAVTMNSGSAAMKFAALFPNKCLSLCVCSAPVQAGEDPEWLEHGYVEFTDAYCFPKDLETLERACMEFSWFAFNGQIAPDLEDEVIAWWQMHMPPTQRSKFFAQALCTLQRSRLSDEELKAIRQPTIFIQGDKSLLSPPQKGQDLADKMPNARVFVVKGGPQLLNLVPEYASVVNRVYCQFLSTLSHTTQTFPIDPSPPNPRRVGKAGLARLARLAGDSSIAERDPSTPLSFSRLPADHIRQNIEQMAFYAKGESEAFNALDDKGEPIRKFSERHIDEWKPAAFTRMQQEMFGDSFVEVIHTSSVSTHEEAYGAQAVASK